MFRISNSNIHYNTIQQLQTKEVEYNKIKKQLSTQKNIHKPHEDPFGTYVITQYQNKLEDIKRYKHNIQESNEYLNFVELQLKEILKYLKEVRVKSLHASNGVLSHVDRKNLATEIDQYLNQLLEISNSTYRGQKIFSGYQTDQNPFVVELSKNSYSNHPYIKKVSYEGDMGKIYREVDKGNFIDINLSGSEVFWSSNYKIISQIPSNDYIAMSRNQKEYQEIKINDTLIQISDGDSLNVIADKINQSNSSVIAYIDNTSPNRFLVLETQYPHKMNIQDIGGGAILQDLGFLVKGNSTSKSKISPLAIVEEKNIFKNLIELRDSLLENDFNSINRKIGDIDQSIDNITQKYAIIGSKQVRMNNISSKLSQNELDFRSFKSEIQNPDESKIIDYKSAEMAYLASLHISSKITKLSLINFI